MKLNRIVLDSNVLISASLRSTCKPREVINSIESANGLLLFSQETFLEFRQRIMRSKFDKYVSRKSRINYIKQLGKISKFVSINGTILGCRDQDDDKFLETAFNGKADLIPQSTTGKPEPLRSLPKVYIGNPYLVLIRS